MHNTNKNNPENEKNENNNHDNQQDDENQIQSPKNQKSTLIDQEEQQDRQHNQQKNHEEESGQIDSSSRQIQEKTNKRSFNALRSKTEEFLEENEYIESSYKRFKKDQVYPTEHTFLQVLQHTLNNDNWQENQDTQQTSQNIVILLIDVIKAYELIQSTDDCLKASQEIKQLENEIQKLLEISAHAPEKWKQCITTCAKICKQQAEYFSDHYKQGEFSQQEQIIPEDQQSAMLENTTQPLDWIIKLLSHDIDNKTPDQIITQALNSLEQKNNTAHPTKQDTRETLLHLLLNIEETKYQPDHHSQNWETCKKNIIEVLERLIYEI